MRTDHAEIVADDLLQIAQANEEHWFRGSSRLNTNDCIVGNMTDTHAQMLMSWYMVYYDEFLSPGC